MSVIYILSNQVTIMAFTCGECGFDFDRRFNLHRHIHTVHREKSLLMSPNSHSYTSPLNNHGDKERFTLGMLRYLEKYGTEASHTQSLEFDRLKGLCCDKIMQHGGGLTSDDQRKTATAKKILECCCEMEKRCRQPVIQVGRGLKRPREESDDETSENEADASEDGDESTKSEETGDSDGGESENTESGDESSGETEDDAEIKEAMAHVMYICCQRPERREKMLKKLDEGTVQAICDCAKGVLKGEIPINYIEKDNLEKHKEILRSLREPTNSIKDKKDIIVQNGGNFLLSLIPTVIGALAALFQK